MSNQQAKLIITDAGDPSVGINSSTYLVECPFFTNDVEPTDANDFREKIEALFNDWAEGRVSADFEHELKADAERELSDDDIDDLNQPFLARDLEKEFSEPDEDLY